jgi:endo-1,4-beta-D-glucanase Y
MRVGLSCLAILTQLTTIQVPVFAQSWSESRANSTNDSFPSPVSYIMASEPHVSNPAPTSGPAFPARPFPQHSSYMAGTILPDHVDQEVLDDSVRSFYLAWKKHYLLPGCTDGEKYVWFEGTKGTNICVSEGQGYGMMIVALMAGFDSGAQETYDCLYRFYKSHPSTSSADLMAWTQTKNCRSMDGGTATDGDMDIAYSLLLADAQWGRHSNIPYRQQALQMIAAIRREEINPLTYIVMEADDESPRSKDYFDMRSSDFMPDHIRAFREATGDPFWDTVLDNNYREFRYLQETYSPDAGLVPDFIKDIKVTPVVCGVPAQPNYLESKFDGVYNFNACRVPWRIAADYLVSGDKRAADFLSRLNPWIRSTTLDKPDNISAGYNLSGDDLAHRNYEALCFICPFAVAAMANGDNQQWLDSLWDYIINFKLKDFDYYDNSIKMIDLIILSGNYWSPAHSDSVATSSR